MFKLEEVFKADVPDAFFFFFPIANSSAFAVTNSGAVCSPTVCEVLTGVGAGAGAGGIFGCDMHILFIPIV
jgi:hypothetical protein